MMIMMSKRDMVSVNVVEVGIGVKLVLYAKDLYMIAKNNAM